MKDENERELDELEEDKEDKVVNFLGIKQSWWRVTSKIYAFVLMGYGIWYIFFHLEHEGSFAEWVQIVGQHMLIASGFLMITIYAGANVGDVLMMLHDWYRNKRDRHRRETEAKLRAAVAALQVAEETRFTAEEARREAEEARRAEAEARRAAEAEQRVAEEARRAAEEERRVATEESRRTAEAVAQLRQDLDAWDAWNRRRIQAAEKGEAFNEPIPNGTASQNGQ